MSAAVEASGLVFDYPAKRGVAARRALDGVSFSVPEGELFGVLGPNGGGKSTLFKVLATALVPSAGRAAVLGHDLASDAAAAREALGVVFQNPSLDGKLTVFENLDCAGRLYGLSGAALSSRISEMLGKFSLSDRAGERCAALSGGLRRRVELAKALLHAPKVVLLDEPSTGLDPAARRALWEHLLALKAAGTTILTTTHLMDEGDRCGRVAILDKGRIVALGEPGALKAEIGGDVVTAEADDAPALARDVSSRFGVKAEAFGTTVRLERAAGHAFIPELVEAFPGRVKSASLSRPSLEDVFLHHAGRRFADAEVPA